jgi:hypothetical protein
MLENFPELKAIRAPGFSATMAEDEAQRRQSDRERRVQMGANDKARREREALS